MMRHFSSIPVTGLRRSSLVSALRRRANPYASLLAILAPRKYERLASTATVLDFYNALVRHCGTLFPVWTPCFDEWFDEDDNPLYDEGLLFNMDNLGIPVAPLGIDDSELVYGKSAALSSVAYFLEDRAKRQPIAGLIQHGACRSWTEIAELGQWYQRTIDRKNMYASAGQEWVGRWQSLEWLVKYVQHDTGYQWLDICGEDLDEGGNPPWTLADIEFLEKDWADAKLILTPLQAFIKWLDARPEKRVPTAIAALMGDEPTRARLSQQRQPGKTLHEVFNGEPQKQTAHRAR